MAQGIDIQSFRRGLFADLAAFEGADDLVTGQRLIERWQGCYHLLRFGARLAQQDDGAKDGVLLDAYPQFEAAAAASHALHEQAFDAGARIMLFDPVQNGICGLRHFGRGAQIEHHAVYGRLVQDIGRAQFYHYWIADLLGGQGRLDGVGNDPGWQGRETGGL